MDSLLHSSSGGSTWDALERASGSYDMQGTPTHQNLTENYEHLLSSMTQITEIMQKGCDGE